MKIYAIEKIKKAGSLLAIAFMFGLTVFAQSNTGSITGVVTDPNGAVVPSVTVTITNQGTNETRTVTTDEQGRYDIPSISTGVYSIEAAASGFQAAKLDGLRLAVGERARADLTLAVSGAEVEVTVVDQTRVDTETSTIGDTIDTRRIADNPVNGRDFTQLLATIPGSVQTTNQFQTSVNGIPSTFGGTSVLVDGIDASRVDVNGTSNVLGRVESRVNRVSMDSIQEVQVVEQNYSAQYGQAMGAVINPITKSGTNNFHGSFFDYFRNDGMDAPDALAGKQHFRLNQFGGNFSGPIIKDKLFFFTNYEGVRQTRGQWFNVLTFTQAFRDAMNPTIRPVVDTIPLPQGVYINPVTELPDPDVGTYTAQRIGELTENTGSVKIDWMHNDSSQFSVRYNINDSDTITPYGVGSDQFAPAKLRTQLFKVSHNYVFNGTTTNEFGFGINHNYTNVEAGPSTLPRFDFSFVNFMINGPGPAQFDQERTGVVYHFLDTVTMVRGDHSLKIGGDIRLNRRSAFLGTQDTFTFFGINELRDNQPFLMSRSGNPELNYANENFSFFINDDWKIHPRLSLNLGLRYEVSTVSRERDGLLQNFDLDTLSYTAPGEKLYNMDTNNWGPRVGFAFDVFGDQKTVLRGGYGLFYNRDLPASFGSPAANSFPTLSTDIITALFFCGVTEWGYPVQESAYVCAQKNAYVIEKDLKTAEVQQWSLNVQRDLGFGTLTVGYVGNHATHLLTDGVVTPRNINRKSILDGTTRPISQDWGDIYVVGGYPSSSYNAMQINFRRNFANSVRFNANYTWGHAIDTAIGFFKDYQDPDNMNADRASSDSDVRHNFSFDAGYDMNLSQRTGGPKWIADGWSFNTITQIRSGLPVNVTSTGGTFGGFAVRPNVVQGVDPYCSSYSVPNCQFNPDAFSAPAPGEYGNAGRNILRGPNFAQVDASFLKNTQFGETMSLQLRMDIFNIFNFANYADPSGGLSCSGSVGNCGAFGKSFSTVGNQLGGLLGYGGPRQVQLSARFSF